MADNYEPEYHNEITPEALYRELRRISDLTDLLVSGRFLNISTAEPDKPRQGDVVYADGTEWDPGSGEGIYYYNSAGAWAFLG